MKTNQIPRVFKMIAVIATVFHMEKTDFVDADDKSSSYYLQTGMQLFRNGDITGSLQMFNKAEKRGCVPFYSMTAVPHEL